MENEKDYTLRIRFWIDSKEGAFLGKGRIILLENIQKTGSITKAAKLMKMSYRQAWQLVENMNAISIRPLVNKTLGGRNGSGSEVTEEGTRIIEAFYKLEKELNEIMTQKSKELKF